MTEVGLREGFISLLSTHSCSTVVLYVKLMFLAFISS